MNYYAIGIGGTGSKCMEALIHACAAGLMPEGKLHCLYIDPDRANGCVGRSMNTLEKYRECKKLDIGEIDLFRNEMEPLKPGLWSPIASELRPTLANCFKYDTMRHENIAAAYLMDVLYSDKEKNTTLDLGFRGYPSIGSAIMSRAISDSAEPWRTFTQKIEQDLKSGEGARIILFGSIFGGTGASGLPTIARKIKNIIKNALGQSNKDDENTQDKIRIGCAMLLPYFSFLFNERDDQLKAKSDNFLINTQIALKYYYQMDSMGIYDTVYLFGDQTQSPVSKASLGGQNQENEPHFIELYAALAAADFFNDQKENGYIMVARKSNEKIVWEDLPDSRGTKFIKEKLGQMTRFAFAYISTYYPMLNDIKEKGDPCRASWYIDLFERENIKLDSQDVQQSLDFIKEYCEKYLTWLSHIHMSAKGVELSLFKHDSFSLTRDESEKRKGDLLENFKLSDFNNLMLPFELKSLRGLGQLWEEMSCINRNEFKSESIDGVGRLINALYKKCHIEFSK